MDAPRVTAGPRIAGRAAAAGAADADDCAARREPRLSRAATSVLAFGAYLALLGAGLFTSPNGMLAIFGQPPTQEPWLRVLGLVSLVLGFYYVSAARGEATVFFRATIGGRALGAVVFAALALSGAAPRFILLMAGLDGAGALWTWSTLRRPRH
jgi:hypothetical protein